MLGGKNKIVEVDEALFGKKRSGRIGNDNVINKLWVFGLTERDKSDSKNSRFIVVPNKSK